MEGYPLSTVLESILTSKQASLPCKSHLGRHNQCPHPDCNDSSITSSCSLHGQVAHDWRKAMFCLAISLTRQSPINMPTGQLSCGASLSLRLSSQMSLGCVKLTKARVTPKKNKLNNIGQERDFAETSLDQRGWNSDWTTENHGSGEPDSSTGS